MDNFTTTDPGFTLGLCYHSSHNIVYGQQLSTFIGVHTVWHENFTWNLILRFYGWWQNRKIKIRKLRIRKSSVYHYKIEKETGLP